MIDLLDTHTAIVGASGPHGDVAIIADQAKDAERKEKANG